KGHELDTAHVFITQPGGFEDGPGIQFSARLRRADRDALALEIGQRLDAGFLAGDDLDVVRVGGGDGPQTLEWRLEAGVFHAVPGIVHRIAEGEGQFAAPGLQQVEVFHRGFGGLYGNLGIAHTAAVQLGNGHAYRVIHPAGAAGEDVDERGGSQYGRAGREGRGRCEKTETSWVYAHVVLLLFLLEA